MATIHVNPKTASSNLFEGYRPGKIATLLLAASAIALFVAPSALVINDERQATVITRLGQYDRTIYSGLSLVIPGLNNQYRYRLDTQTTSADASAATKDQQSVNIRVSLFHRLDGSNLEGLYKKVKDQQTLNISIIPSLLQEAIKSVSARYTAAELLEKRDNVKSDVEATLQERLKEYFVLVNNVNIENLDYSPAFDAAIEQKVIAEQEALRAREQLEKEKINTEISAEKAKQTQVEGSALQSTPAILQKQFLEKWDGKLPTVAGQGQTILDINSIYNSGR